MLKFPSSGRVPFISSSNIKMSHRICHGNPKSGVWAHFDEVSEEGSKRASSSSGSSSTDVALPSPSVPVEQPGLLCQVSAQLLGPKPKKAKLLDYFDRPFSAAEQIASERAQALMVVMNAHSYNSQTRDWTHAFFRSLRADYVPPSAFLRSMWVPTKSKSSGR